MIYIYFYIKNNKKWRKNMKIVESCSLSLLKNKLDTLSVIYTLLHLLYVIAFSPLIGLKVLMVNIYIGLKVYVYDI